MNLIYDGLYRYRPPWATTEGVCHLRVYLSPQHTVAICGELTDNPGPSVTNAWDVLADQIRGDYGPQVVLIEHYPPSPDRSGEEAVDGAFHRVTPDPATGTRWTPMGRGYVENLLLGQIVQVWPECAYTIARIEDPTAR